MAWWHHPPSPRRVSGERESSLADPHGGPAATDRAEIIDAGMPMPALVSSMLMPSYVWQLLIPLAVLAGTATSASSRPDQTTYTVLYH
jgi:hypothetical protein